MDSSLAAARHFSRLVWLLLHESGAIVEQKGALRAIVTLAKEGAVSLATEGYGLYVNDVPVPDALAGVQDLAAQFVVHGVREVVVEQGATPADVLGVARVLTAAATSGDRGQATRERLRLLGPRTVRVEFWDALVGTDDAGAADALAAPDAAADGDASLRLAVTAADDHAARRATGDHRVVVPESDDPTYLAFAARRTPDSDVPALLEALDAARTLNATLRALDDLVTLAEDAERDAKRGIVGEVAHALVARERALPDSEGRRAHIMAIRRLVKPSILRAVGRLLVERRDRLDEHMTVLDRAAEDGADAVIELLTASEDIAERRIYFDALTRLGAAVPTLVHMLGDARWYVARNAAELLGELRASEGELPLVALLAHADDRVRRATVAALTSLGSPRAMQAVHGAMRDPAPQVRMQAVVGLARRRGQASVVTLVRALDDETDDEVRQTIMSTLGRVGTPDAVAKLAKVAEAEGWLFRKKPTPIRVQAIRALGEAKASPQALSALQSLQADREREVRDAASRALESGEE